MAHCGFAPGERVAIDKNIYHIRRKISGERWQLENALDGELLNLSEDELHGMFRESRLKFIVTDELDENCLEDVINERIKRNFSDYPKELQKIAKNRLKYVKAIENVSEQDHETEIASVAQTLKESDSPSVYTVRRWLKRYIQE